MRLRFSMMAAVALMILLIFSGGCAHRDPSIQVTGASIGDRSAEALVLHVTLDLANPNNEALRLRDFDYSVTVNGVAVYSGVRSAEATLAPNDHRQLQVPAVVRLDQIGATAGGLPASLPFAITGQLKYIAPGHLARIFHDMGFPNPSASFAGSGNISQ